MDKNERQKIKEDNNFRTILKCMLSKKHMTQNELSEATGLSKTTISYYVQGRSTPTHINLEKISKALSVPPQVFYSDSDKYMTYLNSTEKIFSNNLCTIMKNKGITQDQLANGTGVSRQSISYYMNGRMTPRPSIIEKIAKYFDVTPQSFFLKQGNTAMKLLVTKMPYNKEDCKFINDCYECIFGGICDFCDGVCSYITDSKEIDG